MRITQKSITSSYLRDLESLQDRKLKDETRLNTGKALTSLSDAPDKLVDSKRLSSRLTQNNNFLDVIGQGLGEMRAGEDKLQSIGDKIQNIRQITIDATQIGSTGSLYTLGNSVKGLLMDIITDANADFNGKYLFSGSKTTPESLTPVENSKFQTPFELIEGTPTKENPSGLTVAFKGNFEKRLVNKDVRTTEQINTTADDLFGASGTETFTNIVNLVNKLCYNSDGKQRSSTDLLSKTDLFEIDGFQKTIQDYSEGMSNLVAGAAERSTRMQTVNDQIVEENVRLKEMKSLNEDTDYAKTVMSLKLAETSLQYSLQIGAKLMQHSLFDFLT